MSTYEERGCSYVFMAASAKKIAIAWAVFDEENIVLSRTLILSMAELSYQVALPVPEGSL